MNAYRHRTRSFRIDSLLLKLDAFIDGLENTVDAAFERDDPVAEDLDSQLAELRERRAQADAEYAEFEDAGEIEEPDYHEGVSVEEQLIAAYAHYLANNSQGPFCSREDILFHMHSVLEDGACHPIVAAPEQVLDAARDAYVAEISRRVRRAHRTISHSSMASA